MAGVTVSTGGLNDTARRLDGLSLDDSTGAQYEAFGRGLGKKYWRFEDGYVNLNHGQPALPFPGDAA